MTPRVDVVGLDVTETVADLLAAACETGHSRFPVYEDTLDHIVGVASVVDALAVAPGDRARTLVATIAREPVQVPESLDLGAVLQALDAAQAALAVVVDEYGGTDGVVTIEDLVEELVGEIADEHDPTEEGADDIVAPDVDPPSGHHPVTVDGMLRGDELEEQTGFRPPPGPYETLAGYLMAELGHIPAEGETLAVPGWEFTVTEVVKRRVEQVRVARTEDNA
jgi:CBS domain containing-hemolysin-like protein